MAIGFREKEEKVHNLNWIAANRTKAFKFSYDHTQAIKAYDPQTKSIIKTKANENVIFFYVLWALNIKAAKYSMAIDYEYEPIDFVYRLEEALERFKKRINQIFLDVVKPLND